MAGKPKHGGSYLPEYRAWQTMRLRCTKPKNKAYPEYGGRGIKVCDRWLNSFEAFYQDMGPKPSPKHEIDRYPDNDGNYEPGNCRWATRSENDRNRRNNCWVEFRGQRRLLIELCEEFGVRTDTVRFRMKGGATIEEALTVPVRAKLANGVHAAELAAREPKLPRIPEEKKQQVRDLFIAGNTYDQIVVLTGVSYNSVGRITKRAGLSRRK